MDQMISNREVEVENEFLTDLWLRYFDRTLFGLCPVVKLEPSKYMIGTELKHVFEKNDQLIVRVGGGFEPLESHINNICRAECFKISHLMRTMNLSYTEAVIHFLRQLNASEKVIEGFRNGKHCDKLAFRDTLRIFERKVEHHHKRQETKALETPRKNLLRANSNSKSIRNSDINVGDRQSSTHRFSSIKRSDSNKAKDLSVERSTFE